MAARWCVGSAVPLATFHFEGLFPKPNTNRRQPTDYNAMSPPAMQSPVTPLLARCSLTGAFLRMFTDTTLSFALTLLNAVVDLVSFSRILFTIYPPLFIALLVYSVGGTAISVALGQVSRLLRQSDPNESCTGGPMPARLHRLGNAGTSDAWIWNKVDSIDFANRFV